MDFLMIALGVCGGLGLFIYGMHVMANGLQQTAGNKLKQILEAITRTTFLRILVGASVTAIVQSSSATTVMLVGFVNAGMMQLPQTVGVIMGSNIGTTITAWLISSMEWAAIVSPENISKLAMLCGAFLVLFMKSQKLRNRGEIIAGFGMLFIGMSMMASSMSMLRDSEVFVNLFLSFGSNPLLGILAGVVVTAIIQSSSASVGILQGLAMAGLVPWNAAVYIIMGQNIGTCVTSLLSAIGTKKHAKSVAYIHLLFNVIGSVIFTVVAVILFHFVIPSFGLTTINSVQIGMVHTLFNVGTTVLLLPLSGWLVKAAKAMAGLSKIQDESESTFLDDRVLSNPYAAINSCLKETLRLGRMVYKNLKTSFLALLEQDEEKIDEVLRREEDIDALTNRISQYMVRIISAGVNERENEHLSLLFKTLSDMERVGDHAENISEIARGLLDGDVIFSQAAVDELKEIFGKSAECFEMSLNALEASDAALARNVLSIEASVDHMEERFRKSHIKRLAEGSCSVTGDVAFVNTLTDFERISDHAKNIAASVLKML